MKNTLPYWNHNTAYYPLIRKRVFDCSGTASAALLDVGCGDGTLCRFLAGEGLTVIGVDPFPPCIAAANAKNSLPGICYLCTDFENYEPGRDRTFDAVIFSASLHHTDMRASLRKSRRLLGKNGSLIVLGLASPSSFRDRLFEALRVIPSRLLTLLHRAKTCEEMNIPVSDALPPMNDVRAAAREILPGAKIRFLLHYRYLLEWKKEEEKEEK